jgi:hypothetical protein
LLLIDRSATAIEHTRRRNPEYVGSGRHALETVDVADFRPGTARFDKVFAVNVNVFWTTPATEELARICRALERDGRLFSLLRDAKHGAGLSGRRAGSRCAPGGRLRKPATRLALRDPRRVRGDLA